MAETVKCLPSARDSGGRKAVREGVEGPRTQVEGEIGVHLCEGRIRSRDTMSRPKILFAVVNHLL